ncbi:MAG: dTDP-4-dehydrorhamnose 3,5-epimerase [Methylobacteriaceae bacterium]|nr:dTDP-4-dehydrorhamnose 3,5-epimerase [Methylobacteriaceae bacterium]
MARVTLLKPKRHGDERGWFQETYARRRAAEGGFGEEFVQDNQSFSRPKGTLRGLHFQTPPHGQAKLVRCLRGRIFDVAVDVRRGSPTFGRWVAAELTAENGHQLYVPVGFAHAFLTLEPDCEVAYKVSDYYAPQSDGGIRFDDPDVAVAWPLPTDGLVLSPKDLQLPRLAEFDSPFPYDGEPLPAHLE